MYDVLIHTKLINAMSIFPGLLHQIFPAAAHKWILFQQIPELAEATGLAMRIPMAMD
jgi:hypothetical protein